MVFKQLTVVFALLFLSSVSGASCPQGKRFGSGPSKTCTGPTDPNNKPKSGIESWLTREVYYDLFPKENLGWGPNKCFPYSYEAFVIAARYFPKFGNLAGQGYNFSVNTRRDVAGFFAHAIQETGENDYSLYSGRTQKAADDCFYRGGFYNWFEGGADSPFLTTKTYQPSDGNQCTSGGQYCSAAPGSESAYFYPCGTGKNSQNFLKSCYFGRGAIQLSYNFNYGKFQQWLATQNIKLDLLNNPNLVMTHTNPPLSIMASLWFYMTPQPPKPAMHSIVIGYWNAGAVNNASGYAGAIFGPTSKVVNNECNGEDGVPGGAGENRRIKAFKWFCNYFNVWPGIDARLTCKNMKQDFQAIQAAAKYGMSYGPDWTNGLGAGKPCQCNIKTYPGEIPYFSDAYYPEYTNLNEANKKRCQQVLYANPALYGNQGATCLKTPIG